MNLGDARLRSQMSQFCGACEAGVEHDCGRPSEATGEAHETCVDGYEVS